MTLNNLFNTIRSFSFRGVDLKTNILNTPGTTLSLGGSSVSNGIFTGGNILDRLSNLSVLSAYYLKLQELEGYRNTELTDIIISIYKDYIVNYINQDFDIITIDESVPDWKKLQLKVNTYFKQISYITELTDNLDSYLYYKSYSFRVIWDESERRYKRLELENPTSVVKIDNGNLIAKSNLVVSRKGNILEVDPNSIVTIGKMNLGLGNDLSKDNTADEDSLIREDKVYAATPLFYMNSAKVKEYLLKEQLISLLSIKDLIQPLLMLLRTDGNTSPDEANKLALNVENLINKYSDLSVITGANFSISELMDMVLSNIRVVPDFGGALNELGNLDLSKISDKIQSIRGDQDNVRELILNGAAIPRSLYAGETTKWDAIKSSQRLANRVNFYINDIKGSCRYEACKFIKWNTGQDIDMNLIKCKLFKKTEADYNTELANSDIISDQLDKITRIIDNITRTAKDQLVIDPEQWLIYTKTKLLSIDPDLDEVLTEKTLKNYVKTVLAERNNENNQGGY
jgi:hypothetical protein